MKLRRIDKWGVTLAVGLFAVLWGFRDFLPPQRCEVHGEWLKRRPILVTYFVSSNGLRLTDEYQSARANFFPHAVVEWYFGSSGEHGKYERIEFVRCCQRCRQAQKIWDQQPGNSMYLN